ncbi:hypothetical protein BC938DRAFT_480618, partial [Jimgerdemannia flammicorona]
VLCPSRGSRPFYTFRGFEGLRLNAERTCHNTWLRHRPTTKIPIHRLQPFFLPHSPGNNKMWVHTRSLLLSALLLLVNHPRPSLQGEVAGGKAVYIENTKSVWLFSAGRLSPTDNQLHTLDLSGNSVSATYSSWSDKGANVQTAACPILHFIYTTPAPDGVSFYVYGAGSFQNGTYLSTTVMCSYNTRTGVWALVNSSGNAPPARRNSGIAYSGYKAFIWGGDSDILTGQSNGNTTWHNEADIFDLTSNAWLKSTTSAAAPRSNHTVTALNDGDGRFLVLGGILITDTTQTDFFNNFSYASMSELPIFNPHNGHWDVEIATGSLPPPRKHHTAIMGVDGHTVVVYGGETNSSTAPLLGDVWTLDTTSWTWSQAVIVGAQDGLVRSNHSAILIGSQMLIIAGTNATSKLVDMRVLDLTSWTWVDKVNGQGGVLAAIGGIPGAAGIGVGGVAFILICLGIWWCVRKAGAKQGMGPPFSAVSQRASFGDKTKSLQMRKVNVQNVEQGMPGDDGTPEFILLPVSGAAQKPHVANEDEPAPSYTNVSIKPNVV